MQQTLLALLALMMVTVFNFNQMQANVRNEQQVVRAEMRQMAVGVAMQTMEVIRARAFDDATVGLDDDTITTASTFSTTFPSGNDCAAFGGSDTCDDVDDFDEMVTATVPFKTPEFEVDFNVDVEVDYVDSNMDPTGGPTYGKQVTVLVQDAGSDPFLHEPIRFSEVLTYH